MINYEQRYKTIIKQAKELASSNNVVRQKTTILKLFPELEESNNSEEDIINAIIDVITFHKEMQIHKKINGVKYNDMIHWLERQMLKE